MNCNNSYKTFLVMSLIIFLISCGRSKKDYIDEHIKQLQADAEERIGQKINFPDSIIVLLNDETHRSTWTDIVGSGPKIISVVWGDCGKCVDKMKSWENLLKQENFHGINLIFFLFTENLEHFVKIYYPQVNKIYPIIFDPDNSIMLNNDLPFSSIHQTFLVSNKDKIIAIGDPLDSENVRIEYIKAITSLAKFKSSIN